MTAPVAKPARIVDAHVHLWDPALTEWYPYLSGREELDMGDVSGMSRRFDATTYFTEAAGWNVEKLINVAAATGWNSIEETLELNRQADVDGRPDVIIGGLPPTDSVAETVAAIDRQLESPRFRGARPMGAAEGPLPGDDVLHALHERDLLVELMIHPDLLLPTARRLESIDAPVVVLEHAGWPRNGSADEYALWSEGITALGSLGPNVVCKLSGLTVPLGSMGVDVLAPWLEFAIEAFGTDRCMFASNFPVDGISGTLDELLSAYSAITAHLDTEERDRIFAGNAERIYRC
ncbi:putative TIM-barrel fold metal-dependent hydrolase [Mycolicibacterium sp. BK556]|uniref:amidohydrolase family protein n=1 Tax=Mycobacteriaceae TaxID=1762 RepID=UPI00105B2D6A|nr:MULTISPECIES: amidohydrolase family protein [Mycobacteriaceae]MBB3602821.1 putative TIM-barrel fold metal-dependent hydrolase [Mycolicibacterium sp. BK556]MBB3633016.1 putative TIM-barrel fold metal-dependent hydrolase [Mycolicibacterium sp. BK607]MBB3750563.1 putative TIM-barrel fold metal-dependent hydrolase [Mycolicibacterium sp. BK634]TDO06991.1 putative TIM-barrel fold metal-dependent hydrolase [Mycobacterium sp. BK086]